MSNSGGALLSYVNELVQNIDDMHEKQEILR